MEFEDLKTFVKRQKAKKEREREARKQRKIDHFFKKIKKEKDCSREVVHYDGDDEEEWPKEVIVNPVEFEKSKEIPSPSNEAPPKLKETSKELSVRWETSSDVRVQWSREIIPLQSDINNKSDSQC